MWVCGCGVWEWYKVHRDCLSVCSQNKAVDCKYSRLVASRAELPTDMLLYCPSLEPWLKKKDKPKAKKPRMSTPDKKKRKKNFSIKPPPTSSRKGRTKTGFNSKSLQFEPGTVQGLPSKGSTTREKV